MIRLENVTKYYPGSEQPALDNMTLHIDKGEFVFVLGSSGAGKSTLLKLILRELTADSGRVMVNGYDLKKIRSRQVPYLRRSMGVVFQDFRLIPTMTAYENVAFAMRVTNVPEKKIRDRVPFVLNLVGLGDKCDRYPDQLSGGEQQRVALARALVHSPQLIIADEPTGNIDPELSVEIMELLAAINSVGVTVVVVTHEHDLVKRFQKRVIHIEHGRVVADSKPPETEEPIPRGEGLASVLGKKADRKDEARDGEGDKSDRENPVEDITLPLDEVGVTDEGEAPLPVRRHRRAKLQPDPSARPTDSFRDKNGPVKTPDARNVDFKNAPDTAPQTPEAAPNTQTGKPAPNSQPGKAEPAKQNGEPASADGRRITRREVEDLLRELKEAGK